MTTITYTALVSVCSCKNPKPVTVTIDTLVADQVLNTSEFRICDRCGLAIEGKAS